MAKVATMRPVVQKGQRHVKAKLRQESPRHLGFVRSLPCLLCGGPAIGHHLLRLPDSEARGMGKRSDDRHAIPLCTPHHEGLHASGDELAYLGAHGVYGPAWAALLWQLSGNHEQAERAIGHGLDLVRLHGMTEPLRRLNGQETGR